MTPQQIEAMKLALEALKLLTGAWQTFGALDYGDNAITAIEEALAEHAMREVQRLGQEIEQEPVAWVCEGSASDEKHDIDYWQEDIDAIPIGTQLYTTPPQRTWVGLMDEEVIAASASATYMDDLDAWTFAKAIEQALKEKNT